MGKMSDLHIEMQESGMLDDPDEEQCKRCDICDGAIEPEGDWLEGHNAAPIVEGGRCCANCNSSVVIPSRFNLLKSRLIYRGYDLNELDRDNPFSGLETEED